MREWKGKRYWIVGASEGLGRAVAESISRAGAEVIVSARSRDRLDDLVASVPGKASAVTIDVTDQSSIDRAASEAGEIDGMVYLAGAYWPLGSEKWDAEKITTMVDTNFLGATRVLGAVVPRFVEKDAGHIVLTGSLSGFRGLPGAQGYVPSKAGVMTMAECLYSDLRHTGVEVQVVNPGFVRTRLTDKNDFKMPQRMEPEDAARRFFEHMNSDEFKMSYPAPLSWLLRGSQLLPDWIYYPLVSKRR
ncbi:SDR family NAD(P)-dependent oxidoreductase [Histidinibacterium aquaticum]|uniref:SDR family NAD(P)-dependent oxidoreductase n=1 Tax=Histidinibacterium aquaticum TaxID=2613962 RepID=A0A5J5GDL0_9RHOB|nr:SDR family NAD(P)-dependent oxidoreductase [Histidinibacterium aquaticum]KAA9006050.1 SDR family NAD(P)-dependent oxidoreductase [Histidinibacterium aquaticum]